MILSAALTGLVAAVSGPPAAAADDTGAILSRHAAYVGQPLGLVLTYRFEATRTAPASPSPAASPEPPEAPPTRTIYRRGALYREVYEAAGVTAQEGFTGRAFWSANENGYTVVDLENAARLRLTDNAIEADLLSGDMGARAQGTREVGGVTADVVRVTPASGVPADVAFDPKTGAYVRIAFDPDDVLRKSVVDYDGYVDVAPGVRVPRGYHTNAYGRWTLIEHAVRPVTNDELRGPVPTPTWTFASTDAWPIEIVDHPTPLAFLPRGQAVHVRANVNGHEGTFLLDSGAGSIVFFRPYADKLGLTMLGRTGFSGINGRAMAARYARAASIQVGKNTLSNVVVAVAGQSFGDVDGILGYDFLAGAIVDVDTAKSTIRVLDANAVEPAVANGAYAFPIDLSTRQPGIALTAGGVPTRAIFDTGDDFLVMLSDDLTSSGRLVALTDTLKIDNTPVDYRLNFVGVDGPTNVPARCSRLNELRVGPYRYQRVETCFAPARVFGKDGGLIGFDFLKHFNWTFDYAESKLVLTPNGK